MGVTDNIIIDRNLLVLNQLSIAEYYYLYLKGTGKPAALEDVIICGEIDTEGLQKEGFLKIMPDNSVVLRGRALDLFEDKRNNFIRFVETFPVKSPNGRYLSPSKLEGVAIEKLRKTWKKLFKDQRNAEDHVIKVLEAEIEYRKRQGNMDYMQACEAWLNGANYEKYEYLLEDSSHNAESEANDLM